MGKRGRQLKLRPDETINEQCGGGPEREGVTHRPHDPFYNNCTFDMATFQQQLARTYHPDTIAHLAITRKSASNGSGNLHQPVVREANGTQLAVEALLRGKERQVIPLDDVLPKPSQTTTPLIPETEQSSSDFVPPFRRFGRITVEL